MIQEFQKNPQRLGTEQRLILFEAGDIPEMRYGQHDRERLVTQHTQSEIGASKPRSKCFSRVQIKRFPRFPDQVQHNRGIKPEKALYAYAIHLHSSLGTHNL